MILFGLRLERGERIRVGLLLRGVRATRREWSRGPAGTARALTASTTDAAVAGPALSGSRRSTAGSTTTQASEKAWARSPNLPIKQKYGWSIWWAD